MIPPPKNLQNRTSQIHQGGHEMKRLSPVSKMINLSVPDTIDERTINKKKLTPFTIQVRQEVM